jgi:hypothetical protein
MTHDGQRGAAPGDASTVATTGEAARSPRGLPNDTDGRHGVRVLPGIEGGTSTTTSALDAVQRTRAPHPAATNPRSYAMKNNEIRRLTPAMVAEFALSNPSAFIVKLPAYFGHRVLGVAATMDGALALVEYAAKRWPTHTVDVLPASAAVEA